MHKLFYYVSCLLLIVLFSCSKNNEEEFKNINQGMGASSCNTMNMKFSADIAPILKVNCSFCHSTSGATGGVNTETYSGVKLIADNGLLLGTITHASGFSPMPQGKPKLAACDINKIKAWIAQGAQNN